MAHPRLWLSISFAATLYFGFLFTRTEAQPIRSEKSSMASGSAKATSNIPATATTPSSR